MADQTKVRKVLSGLLFALRDELLPSKSGKKPNTTKSFAGHVLQTGLAVAADTLGNIVIDTRCVICNELATHRFLRNVSAKGENEYFYKCTACLDPKQNGWETIPRSAAGGTDGRPSH